MDRGRIRHALDSDRGCMFGPLLPFLFKTTASREIASLHGRMIANRRKVQVGAELETTASSKYIRTTNRPSAPLLRLELVPLSSSNGLGLL